MALLRKQLINVYGRGRGVRPRKLGADLSICGVVRREWTGSIYRLNILQVVKVNENLFDSVGEKKECCH